MEEKRYFIEESRKRWYDTTKPNNEQLSLGCLMRIADSLEKMSQNYITLLTKIESYKASIAFKDSEILRLEHSIRGHRASFTRNKNKKLKNKTKTS